MSYGYFSMAPVFTCYGLTDVQIAGHGCYSGAGNLGLGTPAADGLDNCSRQHDFRLYDIFECLDDARGNGCDCYTQTPSSNCTNDEVTPRPPLAEMTACQRACWDDLVDMANCFRGANGSQREPANGCYVGYDPAYNGPWGTTGPTCMPAYCQAPATPTPDPPAHNACNAPNKRRCIGEAVYAPPPDLAPCPVTSPTTSTPACASAQ